MNAQSLRILGSAIKQHYLVWISTLLGVVILYYAFLMIFTMLRFGEVPNYFEIYDILGVYKNIFIGTPALSDAVPIMLDEAWLETGFKDPEYYGIATWSFMLVPSKLLLITFLGVLVASSVVLVLFSRSRSCKLNLNRKNLALAGVGGGLVGLTSVTLSWVVCCATPSWIVALTMLGMSSTFALVIEPIGSVMSVLGIGILLWTIMLQTRRIANTTLSTHVDNIGPGRLAY